MHAHQKYSNYSLAFFSILIVIIFVIVSLWGRRRRCRCRLLRRCFSSLVLFTLHSTTVQFHLYFIYSYFMWYKSIIVCYCYSYLSICRFLFCFCYKFRKHYTHLKWFIHNTKTFREFLCTRKIKRDDRKKPQKKHLLDSCSYVLPPSHKTKGGRKTARERGGSGEIKHIHHHATDTHTHTHRKRARARKAQNVHNNTFSCG